MTDRGLIPGWLVGKIFVGITVGIFLWVNITMKPGFKRIIPPPKVIRFDIQASVAYNLVDLVILPSGQGVIPDRWYSPRARQKAQDMV